MSAVLESLDALAEDAPADEAGEILRRGGITVGGERVEPPVSKRPRYRSSFAAVALDGCRQLSLAAAAKGAPVGEYAVTYFTLAQSAAETVGEKLLGSILETLSEGGLSTKHAARISNAYAEQRLPIGPKAAAKRLVALYAGFDAPLQGQLQTPVALLQMLNFAVDDAKDGPQPPPEIF